MNIFSLTITLYVLIKATVISAEINRFPTSTTPTTTNSNKNVKATTTTPRVNTLRYPTPSRSLYSYKYNTDTGIQAQEDGHLNNVGTDQEALEARGSYSYTDNDGNTFQVSYIANENGFQPEGAHLPTVPPLIKKALQYIAEHHEENKDTEHDRNMSKIGKSQAIRLFNKRIDFNKFVHLK